MTLQERLEIILTRAWDEWIKGSDTCQERAARLLTGHVDVARERGWTYRKLLETLQGQRPDVRSEDFEEMMAFLDDWEGAQ